MMNIGITGSLLQKFAILFFIVAAVAVFAGAFASAHGGVNEAPSNITGYSKDQCKDGGWRTLGFRNQGQCVSYFAKQQH